MADCQMCSKWEDDFDLQIVDFLYTYVLLNRNQQFPGYCFVVTKEHVTELFHLELNIRQGVMEEVNAVAQALFTAFQPTKINYELLGNMVPHMHWHLIPRFTTDPLWPRPIWSEAHEPVELSAEGNRERIEKIRRAITPPPPS